MLVETKTRTNMLSEADFDKNIAQPQPEIHIIQAPSVKYEAMKTFKLMITKQDNRKDTTFRG
jgi:hypothetical protein